MRKCRCLKLRNVKLINIRRIAVNRGKISEEDTTETPMYVNRGGRLTILQEDQGQLLTLAGEPDGKLRAAGH
ncbi:hypothetical protein HZ91_003655 [Escherichia coli]|nr:hypothetical protein [Escherichia coli]